MGFTILFSDQLVALYCLGQIFWGQRGALPRKKLFVLENCARIGATTAKGRFAAPA